MAIFVSYPSPLGDLVLSSEEGALTGVWFAGEPHAPKKETVPARESSDPMIRETCRWLDLYFSGKDPGSCPPLHVTATPFICKVAEVLRQIPYGSVWTYRQVAEALDPECGRYAKAYQAIGQAVGRNPISILIPCHRVIGSDGRLTGYAGGIERKRALLELEGILPKTCEAYRIKAV